MPNSSGVKKFRAYGLSKGDDSRATIVEKLEKDNSDLRNRIEKLEKLIEDNVIPKFIKDRYSDWDGELGKFIHDKDASLDSIHQKVIDNNIDPKTRSGRQEYLENIINKYL